MFDQTASYNAIELMRLPADKRERYVRFSIALAENEDFEIFDAYEDMTDTL
jgi:hypothetical protein